MDILSNIIDKNRDQEIYNRGLSQAAEPKEAYYETGLFIKVEKEEKLDQIVDQEELYEYYYFMGNKIQGMVFEPFRTVLLYIVRNRLYDLVPEVLTSKYSVPILNYEEVYSLFLELPSIEFEYVVNHLDLSVKTNSDLLVSIRNKSKDDFVSCLNSEKHDITQKLRQLRSYCVIKELLQSEIKIERIEEFFLSDERDDYLQAMHMNRDCMTKLLQLVLDYLKAKLKFTKIIVTGTYHDMVYKEGKCSEAISEIRQIWQAMERGFTLLYFTYKSLQDKLTENEIKSFDKILARINGMKEFIEEMKPLDIQECQDFTREGKLYIPEDFFSKKNHCKSLDAEDKLYLSDGRVTDVSKIERFINGLVENGYIDDDYHTKGSLLARLTGKQLNDVNLKKIVWKGNRKCLFYTVKNYNQKIVGSNRNRKGIYGMMNVFFDYGGKQNYMNIKINAPYSTEADNYRDKNFEELWFKLTGDKHNLR